MKYAALVAALALALSSGTVAAQGLATSPCPAGSMNGGIPDSERAAQDACTQAYDIFQFLAPQLGISLAGGNAILGQGGTLGGLGHFSIGLRANVVNGLLPQVGDFTQSTSGAERRTLPTEEQILGLPAADAALGLFRGFPVGLTAVGGIDLLVSAEYVPSIDENEVSITPERNLQLGYGVRVGVLQESLLIPGVAISYLSRDLPETDIIGASGSNSLEVLDFKLETSAWRLTAGKNFLLFAIAAGVGRDTYDLSATIRGTVNVGGIAGQATMPNTSQSLTRTNYFLDAAINLPLVKLTGEIGKVTGGTVDTFNTFAGGAADRDLTYYAVGIRLGW